MERITDISQVFEEIQMIFVNIQDYAEINHLFQGLELEIKDLFLNSTIKKISLKVEDELKKFMIVEEGTI